MRSLITYCLIGFATMGSCTAGAQPRAIHQSSLSARCIEVTIDELWRNPPEFEGRRVCVSGFLGRMVRYGEASPELFATRRDAASTFSDRRIVIGIRFTIPVQERLSRHSLHPLRVEGVFELESPCLPRAREAQPGTVCSQPPEMRIALPRLIFANGTRFR